MRINEVTCEKLKTPLKVNSNLNSFAELILPQNFNIRKWKCDVYNILGKGLKMFAFQAYI